MLQNSVFLHDELKIGFYVFSMIKKNFSHPYPKIARAESRPATGYRQR